MECFGLLDRGKLSQMCYSQLFAPQKPSTESSGSKLLLSLTHSILFILFQDGLMEMSAERRLRTGVNRDLRKPHEPVNKIGTITTEQLSSPHTRKTMENHECLLYEMILGGTHEDMCSASEAPSLPGSEILMRVPLMRVPQDQIQALAQPRQRRAGRCLSRASGVLSPRKGSVQRFFISHKTQKYRAPNDAYIFNQT